MALFCAAIRKDSVSLFIIIIIVIIILLWEFLTLESEWQQVFSSLPDSS